MECASGMLVELNTDFNTKGLSALEIQAIVAAWPCNRVCYGRNGKAPAFDSDLRLQAVAAACFGDWWRLKFQQKFLQTGPCDTFLRMQTYMFHPPVTL